MIIITYILVILILFIQIIVSFISVDLIKLTAYIKLKIFGMNKLLVKDYRKFKHDSKIMIFQHTSYADGPILMSIFRSIKFLLKSKYTSFKHQAILAKNLGFILTKTKNTTDDIVKYIQSEKEDYLGIASMAGTTNFEDRIGTFSTGAFVAMQPVTPVLIKYSDDSITWYKKDKEDYDIVDSLYRIANSKKWDSELIILEEVTADGCATSREFADKVQKLMAKAYNLSFN